MLFENWDSDVYPNPNLNRNAPSSQFTSPIHRHSSFASNDNSADGASIDSPMFTLERLQWQRSNPKPEDSAIAGVATGNNVLHIATTNRTIITWDLGSDTHSSMAVSRRPDLIIQRIWSSPSSPFHILVATQGGILLHCSDIVKKPMPIRTGTDNIECVCWPPYHSKELEYAILGCDSGVIYILNLVSKERSLRKVYQLPEPNPINGIAMEMYLDSFLSDRYLIMCATKTRLYEYTGKRLDAVFTCESAPFIELFGNVNARPTLQFYREDGRAKTLAWLTGCGLYHGKLQLDGRHESSTTVVTDYHLLQYPTDFHSDDDGPVGLTVTRFHFIMLFAHRLVCYNQLNATIVYSVQFSENCGAMENVIRDPVLGSIFIHSHLQLHEFIIDREDRDIWLHYLNQKDFGSALEFCSTSAQRDQVLCAHGDYLFAKGEYKPAAAIYSQSQRPFETVALMFLKEDESRDALKDFLRRRLDSVPLASLMQRTMICTWLTEIYLDKLNMLRDSFNDDVYEDLITEFIDFLSVYRDSLDRNTTFELISSHGRTDELIQYAEIIGAYDWLVRYSIEQQRYSTALELITSHCESNPNIMQLLYRVAPQLIQHEPELTIDAFIKLSDVLDGVRLLPALHRCEASPAGCSISPALRYLRHVIQRGSRNPILHNYLVALMVKLPGEDMLLDYLHDQEADTEFDMKFALRLCHQEGKYRCCVRLYEMMSLFPEAARLALTIDPQLAKQVALALDTNGIVSAPDRKTIWLSIGRHLLNEQIRSGKSLPEAIELIKQCSPHIQVEDMLPFFPDDLKIGEFRSEIVSCIRQYNERLKTLHDDQETLSAAAGALKKDMQSLRSRTVHVKHDHACDICHRSLFTSRFYVFPCDHSFHSSCSQKELKQIRETIGNRSHRIFESDSDEEPESRSSSPRSDNAALACILCGTDIILTVDAPLQIDELNSFQI